MVRVEVAIFHSTKWLRSLFAVFLYSYNKDFLSSRLDLAVEVKQEFWAHGPSPLDISLKVSARESLHWTPLRLNSFSVLCRRSDCPEEQWTENLDQPARL